MPRYRVLGNDAATDEPIEIVVQARSEQEAKEKGRARGVMVQQVEPVEDAAAPLSRDAETLRRPATDEPLGDETDLETALDVETVVWRGSPSQWENVVPFALCLLVLPIPWALWRWLSTRCTSYEVTSQRLRMRWGVFTRQLEEIEIYRVKDTTETQTLWQRLVGVGTVKVLSSDRTLPELRLRNVKGHSEVRDCIRAQTERMRRARRVRELDIE